MKIIKLIASLIAIIVMYSIYDYVNIMYMSDVSVICGNKCGYLNHLIQYFQY